MKNLDKKMGLLRKARYQIVTKKATKTTILTTDWKKTTVLITDLGTVAFYKF
jgi:hypothetical protein